MPDNKKDTVSSIVTKKLTDAATKRLKTSAKAAVVGLAVKAITGGDTLGIGKGITKLSTEALGYLKKQDLQSKFSEVVQKGKDMISGPAQPQPVNFGQFVQQVLANPLYKDKTGDAGIVSFIAAQSAERDVVIGFDKEWDQVIQHARLMSQSMLEKKASQRVTQKFIESTLGREMAQSYGEYLGLTAKPAVKKAPEKAVKAVKAEKPEVVATPAKKVKASTPRAPRPRA